MKPAILVITKRGKIERVMSFADHNDALDIANAYKQNGFNWTMTATEHYQQGEIPEGIPGIQLPLF